MQTRKLNKKNKIYKINLLGGSTVNMVKFSISETAIDFALLFLPFPAR